NRLQSEFLRECVSKRGLRDETELYEQSPDRKARLRLFDERDPQLIVSEKALVDQDLADLALSLLRGRRRHARTFSARAAGCALAISNEKCAALALASSSARRYFSSAAAR